MIHAHRSLSRHLQAVTARLTCGILRLVQRRSIRKVLAQVGEKTIRVLLVGQQRLFRESLALVLSRLPDIATVEHTGSHVEASQHPASVDIALIAANVPDEAITHLYQALAAHNPNVRIVVLTREEPGTPSADQRLRRFECVPVSARLDELLAVVRGTPVSSIPASQ